MSAQELPPPLCLRLTCQNNNKIASLRAENARLQRIADAQPGFDNIIIAQLRAENARLRAALEDIRTRASETSTMPSYRLGQIMAYIDDRARAALTDTGAV